MSNTNEKVSRRRIGSITIGGFISVRTYPGETLWLDTTPLSYTYLS